MFLRYYSPTSPASACLHLGTGGAQRLPLIECQANSMCYILSSLWPMFDFSCSARDWIPSRPRRCLVASRESKRRSKSLQRPLRVANWHRINMSSAVLTVQCPNPCENLLGDIFFGTYATCAMQSPASFRSSPAQADYTYLGRDLEINSIVSKRLVLPLYLIAPRRHWHS